MIQFRNIYKTYNKLEVLKGINLDFEGQKIISILGPNGSGKTTLIKTLLGMVIPDKGEIIVGGKNIKGQWNYKKDLAYLPQIAHFPTHTTIIELIEMIQWFRKEKNDYQHLIEAFKLEEHLKKTLGGLSGGTRQKVNLTLALMLDTPYLILDEPTIGLDPVALIVLKQYIKQKKAEGKTVVITSHILDFVEELSDEIIFILEGKVYFKGSIPELLLHTQQSNFEYAIASLLKS